MAGKRSDPGLWLSLLPPPQELAGFSPRVVFSFPSDFAWRKLFLAADFDQFLSPVLGSAWGGSGWACCAQRRPRAAYLSLDALTGHGRHGQGGSLCWGWEGPLRGLGKPGEDGACCPGCSQLWGEGTAPDGGTGDVLHSPGRAQLVDPRGRGRGQHAAWAGLRLRGGAGGRAS